MGLCASTAMVLIPFNSLESLTLKYTPQQLQPLAVV